MLNALAAGRRNRVAALSRFLIIPIAIQGIWIWWPAVRSVFLAFTSWDGILPPRFVGLKNFQVMSGDPVFQIALVNNLKWAVGYTFAPLVLGLALAVLLDRPIRGRNVYKSAIYVPCVLSLVATAVIWSWILQPEGLLNLIIHSLGLSQTQEAWLADPNTVTWAIIAVAVWQTSGFVMVLYFAGLQAVPVELEDAARIDGATAWQVFRKITFPLLRPVHVVVLTGSVVAAVKTFDLVWVLTEGGPFYTSATLASYMYQKAFVGYRFGYASALSLVILVISLTFIVIYLRQVLAEELE